MYARIDEETRVSEIISENLEGRYHPSLQWVEVPEWLEPYIDNQFWYDGEALNPPTDTYILNKAKTLQRALFTDAFTRFDARAQRPSTTVLSALMYEAPIPEPDADFIWQLEAIKEENRALLAKLEAAQTWEEAVEITPWIPWESPNPASRQHSRATQNLSGTDNVHLPS